MKTIFQNSLLALVLSISLLTSAQQAQYVGIRSEVMNYFASDQRNTQWCWAASIQMVLNGYGVAISQEEIVRRTYGTDPYGNLPNWTGSIQSIHRNLNNWGIDAYGYPYTVMASFGQGAPNPSDLIQELQSNHPVIIGYRNNDGGGHAVVVTAVSYIATSYGPQIQTIIVRDPWPNQENINNSGRIEYSAADFAKMIDAYWFIRVIK